MEDEDRTSLDRGQRLEGGIYTAAELWCTDPAAAKAQYGPIASWDTSEITDMRCLFRYKADFNGDISRWDVSSVTDMGLMLYGTTSFNGDLSQWDVSKVTDMRWMLMGATSFNGDLSQWDVSNVKIMRCMLSGATSFTHQLGGAWSTSTANKSQMFFRCPGSIAGKTNDIWGTPE